VNRKESFQQYFTTDTKSFIYVTRIAAMHIIFTRIGCTLFTCDMYMCRLRHTNDSVLSSLKMEGIRLLFFNQDGILIDYLTQGAKLSTLSISHLCWCN
jgi:hypothetical protein